jgi:hypothetical protein
MDYAEQRGEFRAAPYSHLAAGFVVVATGHWTEQEQGRGTHKQHKGPRRRAHAQSHTQEGRIDVAGLWVGHGMDGAAFIPYGYGWVGPIWPKPCASHSAGGLTFIPP